MNHYNITIISSELQVIAYLTDTSELALSDYTDLILKRIDDSLFQPVVASVIIELDSDFVSHFLLKQAS